MKAEDLAIRPRGGIQLRTVDRDRLNERVGNLAPARMREVLFGLSLVFGLDAPLRNGE
jgi:hypothetical protein